MKSRFLAAAAAACALSALSSPASAGIYTDDLTRCLVRATTPEDKITLVHWIFSAMSASTHVAPLTTITDADREKSAQDMARLTERLVLVDCRREASEALRYEGAQAFPDSFGVLGETAMVQLMNDPAVNAAMARLNTYINDAKWASFAEQLSKEP